MARLTLVEALCIVAMGVAMVELPRGNRMSPPDWHASVAKADAPARGDGSRTAVRVEAPRQRPLRTGIPPLRPSTQLTAAAVRTVRSNPPAIDTATRRSLRPACLPARANVGRPVVDPAEY